MSGKKPRAVRKSSRNPELIPGVRRYGRVASQRKRAAYLHSKKGDTRTAEQKAAAEAAAKKPNTLLTSKWYSADDVRHPLKSRRTHRSAAKLRSSLTPGTIVIILAGRFRGKRVIFLKQLESGLLLVTGPYRLNGVPLRRVNAAYVIATATKVNISKADLSKIDDQFFNKPETKHTRNKEGNFITEKPEKTPVSEDRKKIQSAVDGVLKTVIDATPNLHHYLNAKFSLTNGQRPHLLKF